MNLPEGIQEAFYDVYWLLLQDLYAAFHLRRKEQSGITHTHTLHSDAATQVCVCVRVVDSLLRLSLRTC